MPRYRYRCPVDGPFDLSFAIGAAPASAACQTCCGTSKRVYSFGAMVSANPVGSRVLDLHAQSQSAPGVVRRASSAAEASGPRYADPRHRMLPAP